MKLWEKGYALNEKIEKFTVGNDYLLDDKLILFDCIASIAHAKMLNKIGILNGEELEKTIQGLQNIMELHKNGQFKIKMEDEDCHTAIENYLIENYGNLGKKIHTGRSRNDQVLTALRLFEKNELEEMSVLLNEYKDSLQKLKSLFGDIIMPGYTHMRKAMPMKISMWVECFIDAIEDDMLLIDTIQKMIDQSPLGTAAGFGIPLNIDRQMTANLLNFSKVMENSLYAQMSRGKFESSIVHVLSQIMFDLNKLATDILLFSMDEFKFMSLPDEFCTGSSLMPQKKNPDVLELIRAKYHQAVACEFEIKITISNLISGYNRDIQMTKEPIIKSFEITKESLSIMTLVLEHLKINKEKCEQALTQEIYATEKALELVKKGKTFRDAYKEVSTNV